MPRVRPEKPFPQAQGDGAQLRDCSSHRKSCRSPNSWMSHHFTLPGVGVWEPARTGSSCSVVLLSCWGLGPEFWPRAPHRPHPHPAPPRLGRRRGLHITGCYSSSNSQRRPQCRGRLFYGESSDRIQTTREESAVKTWVGHR